MLCKQFNVKHSIMYVISWYVSLTQTLILIFNLSHKTLYTQNSS